MTTTPERSEASAFSQVAERFLSRRRFLSNSVALGAGAFVTATAAGALKPASADSRLGFTPVEANRRDTVTLPQDYNWQVVAKWGQPLWSDGAAFDPATRGSGESQERAFGDNIDGMALYEIDGRAILCVNCEYTNQSILYGGRDSNGPETADDIRKAKAAMGVTVVEVAEVEGHWEIVLDSPFNRRITADTPMEITGPARGHALMRTAADPAGIESLGTLGNCGRGVTPWGTYLTCEEGFQGYFTSNAFFDWPSKAFARYGIGRKDWGYNWASTDERFDFAKHPSEPNRFGYVVEIDPADPAARPKKLTALGRFKHENAEVVVAANGQVVVYMGDDARGEFLYRFISAGTYANGGDTSELLEQGQLFVAKFDDDGRGQWLELTPETSGLDSQAEISVLTRLAASAVGATTMDRPEWVAANPHKAEVYCALTNNEHRGRKPNAGGDPTPASGPNPREANRYGQILRWAPDEGDHTAEGFSWDLFVLAGNPTVHDDAYAGSANITAANMFNSPDGLAFDSTGLLWICTDGSTSNDGDFAGMGNNQMLVGDPATGEIRRLMVGPKECEVTGLDWSPDRKTLFAGIQHPGRNGGGHFPDGGSSVPRSCVIAIKRDDGGTLG